MPWGDPFADPQALIHRVYAYVAYRVGDGADADDITSAVFERAIRYRGGFDPRRGDVVGWLIGIARREISEHFSSKTQSAAISLEDVVDPGSMESDVATRVDLRRAVARLDERSRDLVALRYGADLTARQIGEVLDMRTNAVEVALHRALRALREALEKSADELTESTVRRDLRAAE